ncbi:MAG: ATPase, T2SS/T4P/T4SS family [Bowdeniella nasicola]|nr:ATPase, T2SS/T4P/T4SS family [Bowdeniella nasicola]
MGDDVRWTKRIRALAGGATRVEALADVGSDVHEVADACERLRAGDAGLTPPLAALIDDETITDILINPSGDVFIERHQQLVRHDYRVDDTRALAVRLATAAGVRLDDASPIVDATVMGRVRVHAILAPVATGASPAGGAAISLRIARAKHFTLSDLNRLGTISPQAARIVTYLVTTRRNVVVTGATGSGKTTVLAAALGCAAESERLVVIEETRELQLAHPHAVYLQSRQPNQQGAGAITMAALVRAALRMRPDRLVLGEARGAEIREILAAMNTGHRGCWLTVHANSATDVPARLVALGALAGLSAHTVHVQAAAALDSIIHVQRTPTGRVVRAIATVGCRENQLYITPIFQVRDGREYCDTTELRRLEVEI